MNRGPGDVLVHIAIPVLSVAACVLAVVNPAVAAARRHPMDVLRQE